MGISDGTTVWPKVALVTIALALLTHLISFGAPHWARANAMETDRSFHMGLWRFCTYPRGHSGGEYCDDYINVITDDWLKVAQSFATLSLFTILGSVGAVAAYVFAMEGEMKIAVIGVTMSAISGLFQLICVTSFGGKYWELARDSPDGTGALQLHWAYGLACVCCILSFFTAIFMILEVLFGEVE